MRYQALHSLLQLLSSHSHSSPSLILYQEEKDKTAELTRSSDRIRELPEVQILSTRSVTSGEKLPDIPFQIPNAEMSS